MNMRVMLCGACAYTRALLLSTATAATLHTGLAADTFGSGTDQFAIDFVLVGDPGNPSDPPAFPNMPGAVSYVYRIATYEVSRDMITRANNAGGLGISMADMTLIGGNGANRPATGVSWYEAAAFVNWLNTSTGHQPAYNLNGTSLSLWTSGEAWQIGGENLYRHKDAQYFLPSESEWYKAAYYNGAAGVYYDYPTGGDNVPTAVAGGTGPGTAVYDQPFDQGPADITDVGGVSPYGTRGQGGNALEWLESVPDGGSGSDLTSASLRGGYWFSGPEDLEASGWFGNLRSTGFDVHGFRVAAVPEPLESAVVIGVATLGFALWRRRGSS